VSFVVVVPEPIRDEIDSWGLAFEVVDEFYRRLQADLEYGHEHTCLRLAAPTPTFIYKVDIADPTGPWVTHWFTVYLTYGGREDGLYVMQCDHEAKEGVDGEGDGPGTDFPF
jgi:hypothetical protein